MKNPKAPAGIIFGIRQKEFDSILDNVRKMLIPLEESGYVINELDIKDTRYLGGELGRTIQRNLIIKIQREEAPEVNLSMVIPKLIDGNYYIIKGKRKIPMFQLYDKPVVVRTKTVKFKTNIDQMYINFSKEFPFVHSSFLGKMIPFALLCYCYFDQEKINDILNMPVIDEKFNYFLSDLEVFNEQYANSDPEESLRDLGKYYSQYSSLVKGQNAIYAVDIIPKIDIFTAPFIKKSILEDVIDVINGYSPVDVDFANRRVRCLEYIIYNEVCKSIFDLCMLEHSAKKPVKFNVSSTKIMTPLNVSDIVQFDRDSNPIYELTNLTKISLLGPGGFTKENVPTYLRNVHDSMYGRICTIDTPDRENCGVLHDLIPNVGLDDNLAFTDYINEDNPISIPVSMVPLAQHDDTTRLQMSSSQMRQAILLNKMDKPLVQSGFENAYTDHTRYIFRAKDDGTVIYCDSELAIVQYDNLKKCDIFEIGTRKMYSDFIDVYKVHVKTGDRIKNGQIIAESDFCQDGHINLGKNLLTGIMVYYGYNYEDGIVISDRLVKEKVLTSRHYEDLTIEIPSNKALMNLSTEGGYKPLPKVGDVLKAGEVYAKVKTIPTESYFNFRIFEDPTEYIVDRDMVITKIELFANEWCESIPDYDNWVKDTIKTQEEEEKKVTSIINAYMGKDEALTWIRDHNYDKFSHTKKYKVKSETVEGVLIRITAVYERDIDEADKLANRHGNKGVISKIIPHEQMPMLEDGRHLDICFNPLGIISRMNVAQEFELHISNALMEVKKNARTMIKDGIDNQSIKEYLGNFVKLLDRSDWVYDEFMKTMPDIIDDAFIDQMSIVQPPFQSARDIDVERAMDYANTTETYKLFEPISGEWIQNPVTVGYMYVLRLAHIAEEKMAARGIGSYAKKTLQPLSGRKNKGGQRCGEMESACLIGHGATTNLFEFMNAKSDCISLKDDYIKRQFDISTVSEISEDDMVSESVKMLDCYLVQIGIEK